MKTLLPLLSLVICTLPVHAKEISSCHHKCFEQKYACNIEKSHTLNNCDEVLLDCKIRCGNDKKDDLQLAMRPTELSL